MDISNLYENPRSRQTRWFSFENPTGAKGAAAQAHRGRKGAPCRGIAPGERVTLMDTDGPGVVRLMWCGFWGYNDPKKIRKLRIEMYWDGASTPAVNAPFDDFFCQAADAEKMPFENALFMSPEGSSCNMRVPMPFKKHAKIVVVNDNDENQELFFYLIEATFGDPLPDDMLYFHTFYSPERKTVMRQDYEILPKITGCGRFLGCNINVHTDPSYKKNWFGEGEVKVYLDGDEEYPTLAGTGTEDYILSGWGQKCFANSESGCLLFRWEEDGSLSTAFYRLHLSDPIWFHEDCRVTIQQIGNDDPDLVRSCYEAGAKMEPVFASTSLDEADPNTHKYYFDFDMYDPELINIGFEREDYFSSIAYYYLDRPAP